MKICFHKHKNEIVAGLIPQLILSFFIILICLCDFSEEVNIAVSLFLHSKEYRKELKFKRIGAHVYAFESQNSSEEVIFVSFQIWLTS